MVRGTHRFNVKNTDTHTLIGKKKNPHKKAERSNERLGGSKQLLWSYG